MTNPTPEQVEAAARAMRERSTWPSMHWPDIHGVDHIDTSKALALAALVAAAGVPASGSTSDGHHTFDELYDYRMLYNVHAAHGWLAAGIPVVKSWKHSDGELCFGGGWFIVTATLPTGQVSNHYKAEHWGLFAVPEVDLPPEYDGHTPQDAAERLRAAAGVTPQEPGEDHYIELVVEDNEVRTRLMCEAAETASCRMRPDNWEAMESWTEEECTTSGHPCWAVKFIKDGGDEQLYGADQILGRVPVTVEYADGVEVCATQIAAPVQVDEAKLAEVLRDCETPRLGGHVGPVRWEHKETAKAVAEWLRGGGQ